MKVLSIVVAMGAAAVLTTGCGGGVKHLSEITPARQARLTGHWVLNVKESSQPDSLFAGPEGRGRGALPGGGTGQGGGRSGGFGGRGGGMGGGMGGVGGRGGGFGGSGGRGGMAAPARARINPEAIRAMRRIMTAREERLDLTLTDSTMTVRYPGAEPQVLFFGKTVKRKINDDITLQTKAAWDNERVVITRSISGGGSVTEIFEPSLDSRRLVVDVNVSVGGGGRGGREFQRVYYPVGSGSGDR